jgi:hypothetical protein
MERSGGGIKKENSIIYQLLIIFRVFYIFISGIKACLG